MTITNRNVTQAMTLLRQDAHYYGHRPAPWRLMQSPHGKAHYVAQCPCGHRAEIVELSTGEVSTRMPEYFCRR
jgi:hypothetical protein